MGLLDFLKQKEFLKIISLKGDIVLLQKEIENAKNRESQLNTENSELKSERNNFIKYIGDLDQKKEPIEASEKNVSSQDLNNNSNNKSVKKKEWKKKHLIKLLFSPSTIVAWLALLVSFLTTAISYMHTKEEDIMNNQIQLRTLMQRVIALPKENATIMSKYADNPSLNRIMSSYINQENILLYNQVINLVNIIPDDRISSVEYFTLGSCLANSQNFSLASIYLKKAMEKEPDLETEIGITRGYAHVLFCMGDFVNGRKEYEKALKVFDKYPKNSFNEFYILGNHILTELAWAYSEGNSYNFKNVNKHIYNAKKHLQKIPATPGRDVWDLQIKEAEKNMEYALSQ